ncbi:hypothetical protein ACFLYL_01115 [Chloroflexota bacterium]
MTWENDEKEYSVKQLARMLGIKTQRIRYLIQKRVIAADKVWVGNQRTDNMFKHGEYWESEPYRTIGTRPIQWRIQPDRIEWISELGDGFKYLVGTSTTEELIQIRKTMNAMKGRRDDDEPTTRNLR